MSDTAEFRDPAWTKERLWMEVVALRGRVDALVAERRVMLEAIEKRDDQLRALAAERVRADEATREALAGLEREAHFEGLAAAERVRGDRLEAERDEARAIAGSMADMDSWIAEQAGMVRTDEVGEWVMPSDPRRRTLEGDTP